MNIFKEAPFNYFMKLNFILLLIGVISLLSSQLSYGAVFFCSFLTVAFFTGFSLWSIHGIALFRPQFMIAGFVASIGLLVTAIGCLFV